ncbi:MAG: thioredoxin domain-containing protein [Candidatus Thorarchaeota archaeon]
MSEDDELAEIRRRKMQQLMAQASKPKVLEPMADGGVHELNDANFWPTIQKVKIALVDFYGTWCAPCKALAPIFAELAKEYEGKVFFARVDIDRNRRTTGQFGIQSVPNIIVFKNGKPAGNIVGLRQYVDYDMVLERLVSEIEAGQ